MSTVSAAESLRRQASLATHHLFSLPVLVLMAHSRCNCRCVMCDIWQANAEKRELTRADLEPHCAALRTLHVQRVVLSGGEALMHSNLWLLCELLRELEAKITLLSTGLLLKPFAPQIVRWCDEVIVSLDGPAEVHNRVRRVPRAFERLADGVTALRAQQRGYPVSARCVLQKSNYRDLPRIIEAAHTIGLDRVSFMAVDVSSTAFNRPVPWEEPRVAEVALDRQQTAEFAEVVEATIQRFADDFRTGFIAESPEKLRRLPRYYAALHGLEPFPETRCNAPWVSTVIETDGAVRPCFFQPTIGNIFEQPIDDVLNGPRAVSFRRGLDVRTDPICRRCVCTLSLGRRTPA